MLTLQRFARPSHITMHEFVSLAASPGLLQKMELPVETRRLLRYSPTTWLHFSVVR